MLLLRTILEFSKFGFYDVWPSLTLSQAVLLYPVFVSLASSVPGMGHLAAILLLWMCQLCKQRVNIGVASSGLEVVLAAEKELG